MVLVGGLFAFGLVLAIAAFVVTREAGRLAKEPPPPLFRMDEALEWIVAKLPDIVAATLTEADVRRILDFQIEFFQRKGVAGNGSTAKPAGDVVVGGSETVEYILEREGDRRGVPARAGVLGGRDPVRLPAGHRRRRPENGWSETG